MSTADRVGRDLGQRLVKDGGDAMPRADPAQPQGAVHGQQPRPGGIAEPPGGVIAATCRLDGQVGMAMVTGDGGTDQAGFGQRTQRGAADIGVTGDHGHVQLGQQRAQPPAGQ
ncbi:MAG: hypothetical protein ACRDT0_21185 [Pseudonocardiaceae bacterium]